MDIPGPVIKIQNFSELKLSLVWVQLAKGNDHGTVTIFAENGYSGTSEATYEVQNRGQFVRGFLQLSVPKVASSSVVPPSSSVVAPSSTSNAPTDAPTTVNPAPTAPALSLPVTTTPTPNLAPSATASTLTVNTGAAIQVTLQGTDPENKPLTYALAQLPTHGKLTGQAPNLVYTPDPNFVGLDSLTFTANDGQTSSPPTAVTIVVTGSTATTKKPSRTLTCRTVKGRKTCRRR